MDCTQIQNAELLVRSFREDNEPKLTKLLNCFYDEYFEYISNYLRKTVLYDSPLTKNIEEDLLKESFNDALQAFYLFLRDKGFQQKGATVKTLFTEFCRIKLLKRKTEIIRNAKKRADQLNGLAHITQDAETIKDQMEEEERILKIRSKAFSTLDKRCADLLLWRKVERLSNEEIAGRMDKLQPGSVTNEVYRCVKKLNELANQLLQGN